MDIVSSDTSRARRGPRLHRRYSIDLLAWQECRIRPTTGYWFHEGAHSSPKNKSPARRPGFSCSIWSGSVHHRDHEFRAVLDALPHDRSRRRGRANRKPSGQFIVGMTNSAPSLMPWRTPAAGGEDVQTGNRPVSSSSG
jgi:hypothetical protein